MMMTEEIDIAAVVANIKVRREEDLHHQIQIQTNHMHYMILLELSLS